MCDEMIIDTSVMWSIPKLTSTTYRIGIFNNNIYICSGRNYFAIINTSPRLRHQ